MWLWRIPCWEVILESSHDFKVSLSKASHPLHFFLPKAVRSPAKLSPLSHLWIQLSCMLVLCIWCDFKAQLHGSCLVHAFYYIILLKLIFMWNFINPRQSYEAPTLCVLWNMIKFEFNNIISKCLKITNLLFKIVYLL